MSSDTVRQCLRLRASVQAFVKKHNGDKLQSNLLRIKKEMALNSAQKDK